jgi:hypothetical protein
VLRKIFGLKRVEETGDWRKLQNEEIHGLCCSPNVIWMRLQWNVAHIGRKEVCTQIWWGNLKERDYLEDLGRDYRVILKYSFIP